MAKEIVQSMREVNGQFEKYYFATVLSAVSVTSDDNDTRNAKEYIDSLISATSDAMRFMGVIGADGKITSGFDSVSGKTFSTLTDYAIGWSFKIGVAGTYAGNVCEVGDMLVCIGTAKSNDDWYVLQANIDGAVVGPSSSTDTALAMFDGTTGKIITDSTYKKQDIADLVNAKHTHDNMNILNSFSQELLDLLNHLKDNGFADVTAAMVTLWNGYEDKIKAIEDAMKYTNNTATISALGGISAGSTFDNVSYADMFTKLLYPYVSPTVSASVVSPSNGGVFEKGTTQNVTKIRAAVTKKSASITKIEVFDGSTSLASKTDGVTSGGTFDFTTNVAVTTNKNFTVKVTDSENKTVSANTGSFTFVNPFYVGSVAGGSTVDESLVTGLTKKIEVKGAKSITYNCDNQCMIFAYDASYGNLKSIMDPNNFNVTDTFTKSEINITTLDGNSTKYYVYMNTASTVSNFVMKFNF